MTRPVHDPISLPEIDVLDDYTFIYDDLTTDEPHACLVLGSFNEHSKRIRIDSLLHGHQLLTTLLHELVHLVQFEDNLHNWTRHYALMNHKHGYDANPYEVEAKNSFGVYHRLIQSDKHFAGRVRRLLGR